MLWSKNDSLVHFPLCQTNWKILFPTCALHLVFLPYHTFYILLFLLNTILSILWGPVLMLIHSHVFSFLPLWESTALNFHRPLNLLKHFSYFSYVDFTLLMEDNLLKGRCYLNCVFILPIFRGWPAFCRGVIYKAWSYMLETAKIIRHQSCFQKLIFS